MSERYPLGLFAATGIELEYMIVDRATLSVRPLADELIRAQCGSYASEIEVDGIGWSNELALHVIEFKTAEPTPTLDGVAARFAAGIARADRLLEPLGARLMPTGMHPWMEPDRELRLWPHEHGPVYETFHRVFDCRGHGWANLQSVHLNLPFADDAEFGRLHAAVRLLLPILPALAASSPLVEGRPATALDARLEHYRTNARRVPAVSGRVIPEPCFTRRDYERDVLGGIYRELAPLDPEGVLRHEWVNARGAIARFDRGSIEIRVLDVAECPAVDLAIARAVIAALRAMVEERFSSRAEQRAWPIDPLAAIFDATVRDADRTRIDDSAYLRALGFPGGRACEARELWSHLLEATLGGDADRAERRLVERILAEGCLARRILARLGGDLRRERLAEVYAELCACLAEGRFF
jgi:gamma-glutamyl:cysteine ligase YbdK (ATP-grasp superfamily)